MALEPIKTNADTQAPLDIIEPLCAVFRRALKEENLKYTPERAMILDTIIAFDGCFAGQHRVLWCTNGIESDRDL